MSKKAETKEVTPDVALEQANSAVTLYEGRTNGIAVKSEDEFRKASSLFAGLDGCVKRIDEVVDGFNSPLQKIRKDALDAMHANIAMFAEPKEKFVRLKELVGKEMKAWREQEDARIRKEQEAEQERQRKAQEEAERKAKEAEKKGKPAPPPPPVPEPVQVVAPPKTVHTDQGSVTTRKDVDFEIENVLELPKKYRDLILEDAVERGHARTIIGKAVKVEGLKFKAKGIRVFEKTTLVNKTK